MSDEQDLAEQFDDDAIGLDEDYRGDQFGEGVTSSPPDEPMGVDAVGVTAGEEEAGESLDERAEQEVPESEAWRSLPLDDEAGGRVGQLVDPHAASLDDDPFLVAEAVDGEALTAEEAAMHIEPER